MKHTFSRQLVYLRSSDKKPPGIVNTARVGSLGTDPEKRVLHSCHCKLIAQRAISCVLDGNKKKNPFSGGQKFELQLGVSKRLPGGLLVQESPPPH
jgi:hypothetical protein